VRPELRRPAGGRARHPQGRRRRSPAQLPPLPDEAAYVIDNCDARVVYVDAEYASLIAQVADRVPKVTDVLVFDGDGELERQVAKCPATAPEGARGFGGRRRHHDLHVGHDREAQGGRS
jgi:hypothetical protein